MHAIMRKATMTRDSARAERIERIPRSSLNRASVGTPSASDAVPNDQTGTGISGGKTQASRKGTLSLSLQESLIVSQEGTSGT